MEKIGDRSAKLVEGFKGERKEILDPSIELCCFRFARGIYPR